MCSPECTLFFVAQLLLRLLGGKSSVATKIHVKEQKLNSKSQQNLIYLIFFVVLCFTQVIDLGSGFIVKNTWTL
ncbi:hypothetical protein CEX98_08480 [Pseudoalteromonas piscicida]|uniref:Uncharacterized protein n=1 Tax=Pseudoalteromonas piscicida TaxID=43662 RepID=A0A2A5JS46_PSEO7|nr:hypothetical protein CEX98_08480 [Pseudoalteromonas piscicida]